MAIDAPILMPELVRQSGNMNIQKPPQPDGSNTFKPRSLVVLTSGALVLVATAGVSVWGITPDGNKQPTDIPPVALFGENHYCFDLAGCELEINVGSISSNALVVGTANSAKTPGDVTIGTSYGIGTPTSGAYAGYQVLDTTNTTNLLFQVIAKVYGVNDTDANGRVRVRMVPTTLQAG